MTTEEHTRTADEDLRIAFHEAGHAVADFLLGFDLFTVTIIPDGNGTEGEAHGEFGDDDEEGYRNRLISALAGHASEVEFCGKNPKEVLGAYSDFEKAERLSAFLQEEIDEHIEKARRFVLEHAKAIKRVADDLVKHRILDNVEVELLVEEDLEELHEYRVSLGFGGGPKGWVDVDGILTK